MSREKEIQQSGRYRVRERRAPTRWLDEIDASDTLRTSRTRRHGEGAPLARPRAEVPVPADRALFLLGLILAVGATAGLAIAHNASWYTFDFSWIEGAQGAQLEPQGRAEAIRGLDDAAGYWRFALIAPTRGWEVLIAAGAMIALMEPLPFAPARKRSLRLFLLAGVAGGGAALTIAASRLMGGAFAFAAHNEGMLRTPGWALYVMLLGGLAATIAAARFMVPLLREQMEDAAPGHSALTAAQAALLLSAIALAALAISPWIAYGVAADIDGPATPVLTDGMLGERPENFQPPLKTAASALHQVRGVLWILLGAALLPVAITASSNWLPRGVPAVAFHLVALATPLAAIAVVQAVRATIQLQRAEEWEPTANIILLVGAVAALGVCLNYLARGARPALEALGARPVPPSRG